MNQTIELNQYTAVEAFGHTTLIIRNLHEYELRLEMDNDLAEEIMEKLCKRLHGYYVEDKVSELEHEPLKLVEGKDEQTNVKCRYCNSESVEIIARGTESILYKCRVCKMEFAKLNIKEGET